MVIFKVIPIFTLMETPSEKAIKALRTLVNHQEEIKKEIENASRKEPDDSNTFDAFFVDKGLIKEEDIKKEVKTEWKKEILKKWGLLGLTDIQ